MKHNIVWNNIKIEINYDPDYLNTSKEIKDGVIAHLEVKAAQPLPISETGYRSHFVSASIIEKAGGAVKYVTDALDEAAKNPKWKKHFLDNQQLSLF